MNNRTVSYRRTGRRRTATGTVCGGAFFTASGPCYTVQPGHRGWKRVTVTTAEIAAASDRPIVKRAANRSPNGAVRKPKPKPVPRWKSLIKELRSQTCVGNPILAGLFHEAATEIEHCHSQPHLPLLNRYKLIENVKCAPTGAIEKEVAK